MTAQEKAKELVHKFLYANEGHFYQDSETEDLEAAKECALVAIDEILLEIVESCYGEDYIKKREHWTNVKQEIDKL